jgi:hypothetical protein
LRKFGPCSRKTPSNPKKPTGSSKKSPGNPRRLYRALAGAIIPENVRDYALKQGFYIIEQSGDRVNVIAPEIPNVKTW